MECVVSFRSLTTKYPNRFRITPGQIILLGFLSAFCTVSGVGKVEAKVFSQEAIRYGPEGSQLNLTVIDPDSFDNLEILPFSLGFGRTLEIHTNLPSSRVAEINSLAEVVRRCYDFLEEESGRPVNGSLLLYLLQYPKRPNCYRFEVEMADSTPWNQVRVVLLDSGQPLLGPGASPHVTEFIFDTLPHELTHGLLTSIPTVRHDLDGRKPQGTRWFIEGVCEKMAKDFSFLESPIFHRNVLARRNLDRILVCPDLGSWVWQWGPSGELPWSDESDLYGLSMLLVATWSKQIELRELVALMARRGGDLNGDDLKELLLETAGFEPWELLARAKYQARQMSSTSAISLLQVP